nr:rod shape-determining protein MreD [Rhizomicrobium palustre]
MGGFGNGKLMASIIPVLFGLLGVVLTNLPFSVLSGIVPAPMYALMPIYYWCLVRPDLMSPVWAFLIGIAHDMISGEPPGIWAAAFVATYAVIDKQRDAFAGLSGFGAILGFATAALVTCASHYVIYCFYRWQFLPVTNEIKEFAVTSILYIPVVVVLASVHRRFVGPLRSEF